MRQLILIKHAKPTIVPGEPPSTWPLSEEGRASCESLANALLSHHPGVIVSSGECKAQQTAELLAKQLGIAWEAADNLHEHDRDDVPHMPSREFISLMALVFKQPHRRVLGRESAEHARDRFLRAMDAVIEKHQEGNIAVVSHGTVIALAIEYFTGEDGYQLWRTMSLPSYLVLEIPGFRMMDSAQ